MGTCTAVRRPLSSMLMILMAFSSSQQAFAEAKASGVNMSKVDEYSIMPESEAMRQLGSTEEQGGPRVRIGLRLTPFTKVVSRARDGSSETRFVPIEPLRHTLRARLEKINHFFVGDYHIESRPTKWIAKTRRYEVRLNVYRRYGAYGQLEEALGAVDLSGILEEQDPKLFHLIGVARQRLRDKFQNPVLDVVAGFAPTAKPKSVVSQRETVRRLPRPAAEAPSSYDGELIRGQF